MNCSFCGKSVPEDAEVCPFCAESLLPLPEADDREAIRELEDMFYGKNKLLKKVAAFFKHKARSLPGPSEKPAPAAAPAGPNAPESLSDLFQRAYKIDFAICLCASLGLLLRLRVPMWPAFDFFSGMAGLMIFQKLLTWPKVQSFAGQKNLAYAHLLLASGVLLGLVLRKALPWWFAIDTLVIAAAFLLGQRMMRLEQHSLDPEDVS